MSDVSGIQAQLELLFSKKRIVMWQDVDRDFVDDVADIEIPGVEFATVANTEYGLKYRMLQKEPTQKFLVYRAGPVPQGIDNWLLDLELAYGVFSADRVSLIMQELNLEGLEIRQVIADHVTFFSTKKRLAELKARLLTEDDATNLRAKMTAVLCGTQTEHRLLDILRVLLDENANGTTVAYDRIVEFGLTDFLWKGLRFYGYTTPNPSVADFVLWLFRNAMTGFHSDVPAGLRSVQLAFDNLQHDWRFKSTYLALSRRANVDLGIESQIAEADFKSLLGNHVFEVVDRKIIRDLSRGVTSRTLIAKDVSEAVRRRRDSSWFAAFESAYTAIDAAASLLAEIDSLSTAMQSFDDGLDKYTTQWFRIDQLYRQYIYHARLAEDPGPLESLGKQVEAFYSNKFLFPLGVAWQVQVDKTETWRAKKSPSQTAFFRHHVQPIISGGRNKAVVIISDAFRYEIAHELGARIRQEDRFDAGLSHVLGVLPSYTQLGMAALLPHETIGHSGTKDLVNVDGKPAGGIAYRNKVLEAVSGHAIQAEDLVALNRDETRDLYRAHQVLYVYHNRIDATGDKPATEGQVFEAAEKTLRELIDIIKKLTNANATNILITADHGFLYQDGGLDKAGYLTVVPQAEKIIVQARRYVIGKELKRDPAFKTFEPAQLGLDSDLEVQIPKSIHRLKLAGSGARFVHGGASLQEIVVPVLTVNKKRKSDIRAVEVQVLQESDQITTGQLAVKLFQADSISDKVQARTLRAGLYVGETLISNEVDTTFDRTSDDKRDRYVTVNLLLKGVANDFNNRVVELRLDEGIANTNGRREYRKITYTLKRAFATDF